MADSVVGPVKVFFVVVLCADTEPVIAPVKARLVDCLLAASVRCSTSVYLALLIASGLLSAVVLCASRLARTMSELPTAESGACGVKLIELLLLVERTWLVLDSVS